jgi:Putative Actinobacterial Holin-X, holin superfamily III
MSTTEDHETQPHDQRTPLGERSLGALIATLSRDLALLVHQEIELIKTELLAGAKKFAIGAAGLAVAAVLALIAVPVLSIAIALGIHALGVSLGWSFLIVAGGYFVLAAGAVFFGIRQFRKAKPPSRSVGSVKADIHAIARKPTPSP